MKIVRVNLAIIKFYELYVLQKKTTFNYNHSFKLKGK